VETLCSLKSNLTALPLSRFVEHKKRSWWCCGVSEHYYEANYTIKFLIRPSTIDFELWFEGQKYSDNQSFGVEWEAGANLSAPKEHLDPDNRGPNARGNW
jgi:hypothetical protein